MEYTSIKEGENSLKVTRKEMERLGRELKVTALDPNFLGSRNFTIHVSKPIESNVFWLAMLYEWNNHLANGPKNKKQSFHIEFKNRKGPKEVCTRIMERLIKIGHLKIS